jgi:hypothetical protein
MRQAAAPIVILLGLVLLGAAFYADSSGGRSYWTEQDQQAFTEASLEYHKLAHAPPGKARRKGIAESDFETARQRYEVEKRRLDAARGSKGRNGSLLFWAGVVAVGAGVGGALWQRGQQ